MLNLKVFFSSILIFFLSFFLSFPVFAQSKNIIQNIVVFGDSLSDNGNYFRDSSGKLPPPPYQKVASNGLVWPEYLALFINATKLEDEAYIGALTDGKNNAYPDAVSFSDQIENYIKKHPQLEGDHTLYVLWAGANNIFAIDPSKPILRVPFIDIARAIAALQSKGARYFLVPGLPNFATIPLMQNDPFDKAKGIFGILSSEFNYSTNTLANLLNPPQPPKNIIWIDVDKLFTDIQKNPGQYGFNNVTAACYNDLPNLPPNPQGPCATPNTYLFWDLVHPTTKGHYFLARYIYEQLANQGLISKQLPEKFNNYDNLQKQISN